MAAPATTPGLTPAELEQIRDGLANGRKPKVVFTAAAGQIAGQVGQVVELTDPADSDEWILVRFGRDELPFSPSDLAVPTRGKAAPAKAVTTVPARAGASRRTATAKAEPEFKLGTAPAPAPREGKTMLTTGAPAEGTITTKPTNGAVANEAVANGAAANGAVANGAVANGAVANGAVANGANGVAKIARPAKAKPPASLVVTLAYTDKEWTVAATQGSKSLAKPYVIKPTEALRMVALIDVPGVHEAVEAIIAAERAEAEGRANRLRQELAELESRLAELTHNG
jgi:hypothetical protein